MYFYSSAASDSPVITNTYGDLNKVLNYIIDGGTEYTILKIEPSADKKVKIWYDTALTQCPWILSQSITISSGSASYNNYKFLIEAINVVDKYVICYNSKVTQTSPIETASMKAKITPAGITKVFGGVDEKRTVFRFSGNSVEYRLDDRDFGPLLNPPITTTAHWTKVARVCMSEYFDTLDSTSTKQYPFNVARPTENFTPSGNYIGQAFLPYTTANLNKPYITNTSYTEIRSRYEYRIWASDKFILFQFMIYGYNDNESRFLLLGNFDSIDKTKKNGLLMAQRWGGDNPYNTTSSYLQTTQRQFCSIMDDNDTSGRHYAIFNNYNSSGDTMWVNNNGEFYLGGGTPSGAGINVPNNIDKGVYFSNVIVQGSSQYFGNMYDCKWINSTYDNSRDSLTIIDGELYMLVKWMYNNQSSRFFIKLDRE